MLTVSACGQSLVEPEDLPSVHQIFEMPAYAAQLRCEIRPVRPALNFGFHFQTGYTIDIPLAQLRGSGHGLTTHVRVTPEGREPVYLTQTGLLPDVPKTKADGEIGGTFIVGEGTYDVEVMVEEDDQHRSCSGAWQIQARPTGSERQLKPTMLAGTVDELLANAPQPPHIGPRIARLTILVHSAPLSPSGSNLQPDEIQRLVDSLSSLL